MSHAEESSNNMQILCGHAGHAKVSNLINYFYFYLPLRLLLPSFMQTAVKYCLKQILLNNGGDQSLVTVMGCDTCVTTVTP